MVYIYIKIFLLYGKIFYLITLIKFWENYFWKIFILLILEINNICKILLMWLNRDIVTINLFYKISYDISNAFREKQEATLNMRSDLTPLGSFLNSN